MGRELHIHEVGKARHQEVGHQEAELRRNKPALFHLHVLSVPDDAEDAGVSAGPPDAILLEDPHQGRF